MSELKLKKLKMQTPDICEENIKKLKELFPQIVSEDKIDFDILKQLLSNSIVEADDERYRLDWVGKKRSLLKANTPINKTLRPCVEESVDFENTKNLYIEGDNFEVLKLLQESYLSKIKMIYIDPPYNTGKDFVYRDNFTQKKDEFEDEIGLRDEEGNKLFKNTDSNGRFHSDWLSMMYERLIVARDLLKDDGVIFISIDDNEVHNLRKICDEIFGEGNFIAQIIWMKGKEGGNDNSGMGEHHEYIIMYGKSELSKTSIKLDGKDTSRHITTLNEVNFVKEADFIYKEGEPFQLINLSKQKDYELIIPLKNGEILKWEGYCPQSTLDEYIRIGKVFVGKNKVPYVKSFLSDEKEGTKPSTLFEQSIGTTKAGGIEIKNLFEDKKIFSYPKPSSLIFRLIEITCYDNDIIMDFFSGSASTQQAIFNYNLKNNTHIKSILVQLAEKLDLKNARNDKDKKNIQMTIDYLSSIQKKPFLTEIGKERIRRAGKKIIEDSGKTDLDIGFRVLKVDSSNMKDVYYHPADLKQSNLLDFETNIKEDRNDLDLLFSIMLDLGITLDLKITTKTVDDKKLYIIENSELVVCFENSISLEVIEFIKKEKPLKVVLKDGCFENDTKKINAINELSLITNISVI